MMAQQREESGEVMLKSRSFSIGNPPLTPVEKVALNFLKGRASQGSPVSRADIVEAIGSQNWLGGTAAGILNRLEEKGLITRTFFQRGVQVCIVETGQCTAAPTCTAPHWRNRTENVPAPAIQAVRERVPTVLEMAEKAAKLEGCDTQTMLHHFVYIGAHAYMQERDG